MGFNKRYVNKKIIKTVLSEDGIDALINFIKKPDALIIEDVYSQKVCDIILDNQSGDDILNKILNIDNG
ncbi:MAG: hypothetical protein ACK5OW_00370 [bacterium]|jgi:hypothetical protein